MVRRTRSDGVLRVFQPSQAPDTSHVSDIWRRGRTPTRGPSGRVSGFEPTVSSSRTAGRAVNGGYFRRSPASGGRCGPVLVGGVAVLRSCTAALAAQSWAGHGSLKLTRRGSG